MELKDYAAIVRKRILVIIGVTLVIAAAAFGFSYLQKPFYRASTQLMVSETRSRYEVLAQFSDQYPDIKIAQEVVLTINTIKEIMPSVPVLERASNMVNHKKNVKQFEGSVSSQVLLNTQLIEISANDRDPQMAKEMANAVADSTVSFLREKEGADVLYKIEQVAPALKPSSPVSSKPLRNGIIGGFVGLILGLGVAFLLEYLNVNVSQKGQAAVQSIDTSHLQQPTDTKKCPYCAETIKSEAIKCKHCGSDLDQLLSKQAPEV